MDQHRGRVVDVDDLADLTARLAAGAHRLSGWRIRGVDVSGQEGVLARAEVAGASFVGCAFAPGQADRLAEAGALVLPARTDPPVRVDRRSLYTPEELYGTGRYADSLDARAYAWARQPDDPDRALARALHDHAVDRALTAWAAGRRLAGVMGGHATRRGEPAYAAAARLGRALARAGGLAVATGGGPGAMEAAGLGAWYAARPPTELDAAIARLAVVPAYRPSVQAWARVAFEVRDAVAPGGESLAIPTWHYGHEPPHVFATVVAKYFRNATREAILLELCGAGIVFLPGAGGTVQEIFQDACENYYADETSLAPMVLVGVDYWTRTLPVWPLLRALARGRAMEPHVHLVETVEEAAALVTGER